MRLIDCVEWVKTLGDCNLQKQLFSAVTPKSMAMVRTMWTTVATAMMA